MQPNRLMIRVVSAVAILALAAMACVLPLPGSQPAATQPAGTSPVPVETSQATPAGQTGPEGSVLTQVAAAMYTQVAVQQTGVAEQQAAATAAQQTVNARPPVNPPAQAARTQPPAATPTTTLPPSEAPPTVTQPAVTAAPAQPVSAATQPAAGAPPNYIPANPPAGYVAPPGQGFALLGVNLPGCNEITAANFYIYNTSGEPLESASLQFSNLNSGDDLFGPVSQDAPFFADEAACQTGGIDRLDPKQALFIGSSLGTGGLSGQAVHAILKVCSQNGLAGNCYQQTVDFVIP